MTRGAITAAVILALLTGVVIGQIGMLAARQRSSPLTQPSASPQALATALSFYDGIDRLLASGDRFIESTVAPGFVDHRLNGEADQTMPEVIGELLALRATWPDLRIQVVDLQQHGRLFAVWLHIDPGAPAQIPGVPLMDAATHEVVELLRVEGASVSERWTAAGRLPVATLSMSIDIAWGGAALVVPAIERIALAPGQSIPLPLGEKTVLWAKSGGVQLDRDAVDRDGTSCPAREPLGADDVCILEGDGYITLHNVISDPIELWALHTDRGHEELDEPDGMTAQSSPASTVAFMPLHMSTDVRNRPRRVSTAHITLPPGTTVMSHTPGVIEEIAVLSGVLEVTIVRGRALLCTGNIARPFDGTITVAAGEGISANELASLGYHAVGPEPVTILVMRIDALPPIRVSP